MAESRTCPQCGRALSDSAPKGLCSRCLYEAFLAPPDASAPGSDASEGPAPASGVPGTIHYLGDYELLEKIAEGGMGAVFLARQRTLDRLVAVKLIRAGYLARPDQILRFHREARAAAGLQHPHIVAIHEVGEHRGQHYYSMDFVAGRSLARVVNERPQPPDLAAHWVRTIAGAIHYAHSRGVIHRDLKPSNILIDEAGEPHVADFGLAKFVSETVSDEEGPKTGKRENGKTGPDDAPTADSPPPVFPSSRFPFAASPDAQEAAAAPATLTTSGTILGSPNYMPPEQAEGRHTDITPRTDVWSLGAILYELLTGRPPFNASSSLETIRLVCGQEPVPPRRLNPSIPRDLETICLKCLQKPPARRYATAQELADDLGRFLRREPVHARPIRAPEKLLKWTRRHPARAALIAVCVVGVAAYLAQLVVSHARLREQRYAADIYFASRSIERGQLGPALTVLEALRPRWFERDLRGFEWRYFRRLCDGDQNRILTNDARMPRGLAFSSESNLIYMDRGGRMLAWNSTNWALVKSGWGLMVREEEESEDDFASRAESPDRSLGVIGRVGGKITSKRLAARAVGARIDFDSGATPACLAVNNDGRLIATSAQGSRRATLWRQTKALPAPTPFAEIESPSGRFTALAFSHDDNFLATASADGLIQIWNSFTGTQAPNAVSSLQSLHSERTVDDLYGRRVPRAGDLLATYRGHVGGAPRLAFSPDGEVLASVGDDETVRLWPGRPAIGGRFQPDILPPLVFSPDGQRLVARRPDGQTVVLDSRTLLQSSSVGSTNHIPIRFLPDDQTLLLLRRDSSGAVFAERIDLERPEASPTGIRLAEGILTNSGVALTEPPALASDAGGRVLAVRDTYEEGSLVDLNTGHPMARLTNSSYYASLAFSPDGSQLAVGGFDLLLLRAPFKSPGITIEGPEVDLHGLRMHSMESIRAAAFSPDGRWLVTGGENRLVRLREAGSGRIVRTFQGHSGRVTSVVVSPDSRTVASGDTDGSVKLWHMTTGHELATLDAHNEVRQLAFSPDGSLLVAADAAGLLWYWRAPPLDAQDRLRPTSVSSLQRSSNR